MSSDRKNARSLPPLGLVVTLLLLWVAATLYLAFLPSSPTGLFGGSVGHAGVAFVLVLGAGFLAGRARRPRLALFMVVVGGLLAGSAIEVIQGLEVIGREPQIIDVLAEVGGGAAAFVALALLRAVSATSQARAITVVLAAALLGALVGPVRASSPVAAWWECSGPKAVPHLASLRLAEVGPAEPYLDQANAVGATSTISDLQTGQVTRSTISDTQNVIAAIRCNNSFTVHATIETTELDQSGPSRILALSEGTLFFEQNLHLGQDLDSLSLRIRTGPGSYDQFMVANVFTRLGQPVEVLVRYRSGNAEIFVDGDRRMMVVTSGNDLADWADFPLSAGDELTDDRTFRGRLSNLYLGSEWFDDQAVARFFDQLD